MSKQVQKAHYEFHAYVDKRRWASTWHQLDEVVKLSPRHVLEVGPGPGIFKAVATALGLHVETLDLDPELKPDHVASVLDMPFEDGAFDVTCAFQMLEHLPFEKSVEAFAEMVRVTRRALVISLPDAATRWPMSLYIPIIGQVRFSVPKPSLGRHAHSFDGQHYWEINKAGYSLVEVVQALSGNLPVSLDKTFRVPENPYHHFMVFSVE